jgi:diguanylate cyclase (GGDEF)-like protein/PAS domain S-box-containing protein
MTLIAVNKSDTAVSLLAGIEQATIAVVMIDTANNIVHFNAAAEAMWGYHRKEVLGRNVSMLVPIDARQHHDDHIAHNRAAGSGPVAVCRRDIQIERRDGSKIWGSLSISRVEVNGEITYMGFVRDITAEVIQREQVMLLGLVVDKTNRAVYVACSDAKVCYVNQAFSKMFGYSPAEAIGFDPEELLAGPLTGSLQQLYSQVQAQGAAEQELLVYDKNRNEIWISAAFNAIHDDDGQLKYLVAVMTDITESKQLQSLQRYMLEAMANEVSLSVLMHNFCRKVEMIAPDVVCSAGYIDQTGMLFSFANFETPLDVKNARNGVDLTSPDNPSGQGLLKGVPIVASDVMTHPAADQDRDRLLAAGFQAFWVTPVKAKDGRVIGTFTFLYRERRFASRWHQSIIDACVHLCALALEREETRLEIARLAYFDALTGLPNRTHMRQLMEDAIANCAAESKLALMYVDLDHFKDVNDTLGHAVGDELLVAVAKRLGRMIRPGDILSRQGGDEFIVMMPNCTTKDAARIAGRIAESLSKPLQLGGKQVGVTVSAGISMYPENAADLDTLLKYADAAMYKSKQAGRSTYRFFSNDMDRLNEERLAFSTGLRTALAGSGLRLHYQPQIHATSGSLYGVEALARWSDPVLGEVSPAKFIPLAEECGLIEQIGVWSLREACRQMAAWQQAGLDVPCVSVNLSPINFQNAELPALLAEILAANGLAPNRLMLEVTESVVMSEHATAIETMTQIRAAGIGLSMDDFGTGYSSLSQLAHLPVREIKIDRSFMRGIESEASALAIATAVVRVGQSLNMTVVAEGVETTGQHKIMADLG